MNMVERHTWHTLPIGLDNAVAIDSRTSNEDAWGLLAEGLITAKSVEAASALMADALAQLLGCPVALAARGTPGTPAPWSIYCSAGLGWEGAGRQVWESIHPLAGTPTAEPATRTCVLPDGRPLSVAYSIQPIGPEASLAVVLVRDDRPFDPKELARIQRSASLLLAAVRRASEDGAHRQNEDRLRALMEGLGDAIFVHDARGRFTWVNASAVQSLGYTRQELLDLHVSDVDIGLRPDQLEHLWSDLRTSSAATVRGLHRRKDGTTFPVEVKVTPFPREPGQYLAVVRDLTDRQRTRSVLRDVVDTLTGAMGENFLRSLTSALTRLVDEIDLAFVGRLDESGTVMLATDVYSTDGELPDFQYAIKDGPCSLVVKGQHAAYGRGVREAFPQMGLLQELGVEAYVSTPLKDSSGHVMGALTAISRRPLKPASVASVMVEFFATRAASELERLRAHEALEHERAWLQQVLDGVPEPIMAIGVDHQVLLLNAAARKCAGHGSRSVDGLKCHLVSHGSHHPCFSDAHQCPLHIVQETQKPVRVEHLHVDDASGEKRIHEILAAPLLDGKGELLGIVETTRDITERRRHEDRLARTAQELAFMATHDALTDLPNRRLVLDRVEHGIDVAERNGQKLALLFIDLDRFKNINDTLGHDVGDRILQQVAPRLRSVVRQSDTVGRIGGDEFIIVLEGLDNAQTAGTVAHKVIRALRQAFIVGDSELYVGASVGIAVYPGDGRDAHTLLKNADAAMYRAMQLGRGRYQFFTKELHNEARLKLEVERALHHAIDENLLDLHYQPQVRLDDNMVEGCEALLRWTDPILGPISPGIFVPIAEETGQIRGIDRLVLHRACQQHLTWRRAGLRPGMMAVNISAPQFLEGDFVTRVRSELEAAEMSPNELELEVTERMIMRESEVVHGKVRALRDMGVRIAIDDFGTGHSSLVYLHRFAFNRVKIDRSFVRDLPSSKDSKAINRAIVSLARSLDLDVVAEGVETEAQASYLRDLGCPVAQGYYYGHPMDESTFRSWLRQRPTSPPP